MLPDHRSVILPLPVNIPEGNPGSDLKKAIHNDFPFDFKMSTPLNSFRFKQSKTKSPAYA